MSDEKYKEFLIIADALNKKLGFTPLLFGSLGLEQRLNKKLDVNNIDILIPDVYLRLKWNKLSNMMHDLGYRIGNMNNHEFVKSDIRVVFASIDKLVSFAHISPTSVPVIKEGSTEYMLLDIRDYLRVYQSSAKDGFRQISEAKHDDEKIKMIEDFLSDSNIEL